MKLFLIALLLSTPLFCSADRLLLTIADCEYNIVEQITTPFPIPFKGVNSLSAPRMQITITPIENSEILEINFSHYPDKDSGITIDTRIILLNNEKVEIGGVCGDSVTYDLKGNIIKSLSTGYRYSVELIQ